MSMSMSIFLYCLLSLLIFSKIKCWSTNLTVNEEFQPFQVFGNVKGGLPENLKQSQLTFTADNQLLHVNDNGDLTLKRKIDLETLCSSLKMCCGVWVCVMQLNVLVTDQSNFLGSLNVFVRVDDLNDHQPSFSSPQQSISISESSPVNYSVSLDSATDNDFSPLNRILRYLLKDPLNTFELDISKFPQISLRLKKVLDFEVRQRYQLMLQACDKDACAQKHITVEVADENDNKPVFDKKEYHTTILESIDTGSLVQTVRAVDRDSGMFGKVTYSIEAPMDPDLVQTFGVDSRTGQIRLERRLAANIRRLYSFSVMARDGDPHNPQKTKTLVKVEVVDVNNYQPVITVLTINERVEVKENSLPSSLCGIKVTDNDIGNNSKVHCQLLPESMTDFQLTTKGANLYSLVPLKAFDFESGELKSASIICKDYGQPPKITERVVLVHVVDVNEYQPLFKQPTFEVSIKENAATNKPFLRMQATDKDGAALIRYSIDKIGSEYFRVDPMSGWIRTTNVPLDRELRETIVFNGYATDALVDPYTAITKIIVTIEDENDNAPVFGVIPELKIQENQISTRLKGKLTATDADKGQNSELVFVLLKTWARKQDLQRIFHITEDGYVETLQSLDRETFDSYIIEVGVKDKGQYPLATSINITVTVVDQNDNTPQWIYPNPMNPIYNVSRSMKAHDVIMTVRAFDTDEGENGRVVYKLLNSEKKSKQGIFLLDENSGELRLLKDLTVDQVELSLIASDCGVKPLTSSLKLVLNNHTSLRNSPSVSVIIILISVTGFISIVLVVSIICIRKRPIGTGIKYSCPSNMDFPKNSVAEWNFQDTSIYKQKAPVTMRNDLQLPLQNVASSRTSYEPIDAEESGDSGKGPSEDIRNMPYLDQSQIFARNYANLQWKIPSPIPSSICNGRQLYVLPDHSMSLHSSISPYPSIMMANPSMTMTTTPLHYNTSKPLNGGASNMAMLSVNTTCPDRFSLPRSPDYYQTSNHQSQIYETPDSFNSELDITQIQQSNI